MENHTPSPWTEELDEDVPTGWINGPNGPVLEYEGCGSHQAHWRNPADKKLVLAAPDLLKALKALTQWAKVAACDREKGSILDNSINAAIAAIAKAND